MHALLALTSLDGRYADKVKTLADYFSESALFQYRVRMEVEYLIALSDFAQPTVRRFTNHEKRMLKNLYKGFSIEDAKLIKDIETKGHDDIPKTRHDVKAVEIFIRLKLKKTSLADCLEWAHFALTSEDVNNIAYALMLSDALQAVVIPQLEQVRSAVETMAQKFAQLPMLARTHGQPASPTTFGKEFKVTSSRLHRQIEHLRKFEILAKLNGASGNYCAHYAAFPELDWITFSSGFIDRLNFKRKVRLKANLVTTQIEPHDTYAELFHVLIRANNILLDFSQDVWRYISDGWIVQRPAAGEVGSSAMPHKVNPIDSENGEGNLGMANAMLEFFSRKLPISRLQRDLSDSTVERNFGAAFGYCVVAYLSILQGLSKISPDKDAITNALNSHPEVYTEGIQTILRREGVGSAYNRLKDLSRGKIVTFSTLADFINSLEEVSESVRIELRQFLQQPYTGLADEITHSQI